MAQSIFDMAKVSKVFVFLIIVFAFVCCKSKEERAAELIKTELSKTLYDYESYQPIETIVKEAKQTMYNDSSCWYQGALLGLSMKKGVEYSKEMSDAKDHMDIWGSPTAYSSSYSDNQYYKYKDKFLEYFEKTKNSMKLSKDLATSMKEYVEKLDTTLVIGWEVFHRFRCKTKGGNSTIGDYRYVIDKDFKKVLLREDNDDEDDQMIREALGTVISDYWTDFKVD